MKHILDRNKLNLIMDAVDNYSLPIYALEELQKFSNNPNVVAIEVVPEGIFETLDQQIFYLMATVYVNFNETKDNDFSVTDELPAIIKGKIQNQKTRIDSIAIDVSSIE